MRENLLKLIKSDLFRYVGFRPSAIDVLKYVFRGMPGFKYSFWYRVCKYLGNIKVYKYNLYQLAKVVLAHYTYKYGISIPLRATVGSGLYIGHFSGVFLHDDVVIGKNCNLSQGVTIGMTNRGKRKGVPVIGDNVYIGPGAKIIGKIKIGNNVAIGANCVVTKDVPDNAVVVGIPGKIISYNGSYDYVCNTNYSESDI